MEMMLLELHPEEPYVPFMAPLEHPWWTYEMRRRHSSVWLPRRVLGRALIKAGQVMAAERAATAIG